MRGTKKAFLGLIALLLGGIPVVEASLVITPTRVLLSERSRTTTVTIANPTTDTRTYRIEWMEQRMNDEGAYVPFEPGEAPAVALSSMIRHSPKRVTVPAGGHQKVRLQLRVPAGLASGEYRSHLLFKAEPLPVKPDEPGSSTGASVILHVNLSFSIPVIYRHGNGNAEIRMDEIALQRDDKERPQMHLQLSRSGTISSFGNIEIYLNRGGEGREELIGQLRSVSVFADSHRRRVRIPLSVETLSSGDVVRIVYKGEAEFKGKVWAQKSFRVGR